MRPGILLDRDGTIIVDYHYVGHVERVQLIPGAADAIARFNRAGIPVAIVTNQSGVARGFYPERNVHVVHDYIARELALHGAHVDLFLYSPHHPDGNVKEYIFDSPNHKPAPGMAYQAAQELDLDLRSSVVVGDRPSDMEFAHAIKARGIYLGTELLPSWIHPAEVAYFPSLGAAAGYIIERLTGMPQSEFPTMNYVGLSGFLTHYADEIHGTLNQLSHSAVGLATDELRKAHDSGSQIFIIGNGGSAAIANHMATDHTKRMALNASWYTNVRSLCDNSSVMTMVANDIGYDAVFSWQLEQYATMGDVLVAFSVSGSSANIVRALQCAAEMGMRTIAIVAKTGGKAAELADVTVHIPTGNYGIAEDIMSIVMHSMAQYIQQSRMTDSAIQSETF